MNSQSRRSWALVVLLAVGFAGGSTARAFGGTFGWNDLLEASQSAKYVHPNEDLATLSAGQVPYTTLSFWVDRSGVYTLSSETLFEPIDHFVALYNAPFDPTKPLDNLVAADDDGAGGAGTAELRVALVAGVIYQAVTSCANASECFPFNLSNVLTGPGQGRHSACFLDEPERRDDNTDLRLGAFCAQATWSGVGPAGGTAHAATSRADLSGAFWFRDADVREVEVRVLDRCETNGHWWVILSGATTLGFEMKVRINDAPIFEKTYRHPAGARFSTRVDRTAFRCEDVESALAAR